MNFSTSLVQSIQSLTVSDSVRQAVDSIAVRAQQLADAFNSSDPKFIEENDIAIPVDIDLNQFNNLRLLLRPRIGTDIAKKVIDFMSADTINDEDMEYPPDDIIPGSSGSANKSETLRTENNVLHITGCLGSGKSHVLREVAWRVLYGFKNARIVYIPDCVEWAGHNYEAQLEYFCKAVMIGLARDTDSFSFGELKLQPDRAYFLDHIVSYGG
ncbi:hypothetical protein EV175_001488 [Coemansia sp. RSA 1933]|nr:hypothetical protein EV175_001488 [Coemansia sp. RSA 1933]